MDGTKTLNECFIKACRKLDLEKVDAAILLGCDINYEAEKSGLTGLMLSVREDFNSARKIVEKILQTPGINVNHVSKIHGTALHVATYFDEPEAIKRLGRVPGLKVNKEDGRGETAVMIAVKEGHVDCLKALALIPGVDLNKRDSFGDAPIICALGEKKMGAFKFLIENPGVNLQITDERYRTLEQLARESNRTKYLKLIPGTPENQVEILSRKVERLERTREVPECPVCLSPVHPPKRIFQCAAGHIVCGDCEPKIMVCPTCREPMIGRAHAFEQFLRGDQ